MSDNNDLLDPTTTVNSNYGNQRPLPNATATLVLGICSIVGCAIYGIPGLICGIIALVLHQKDKKMYQSSPKSYEMSFKNAKAGFICAVIGTSLSAIYFLFFLIVIVFAFGAAGMR